MRRLVALFVAVLMVAATVEAVPLACVGGSATITSSHACCSDVGTMTAPPAACCAIAQGNAQRGTVEARVVAPALQVASVASSRALLNAAPRVQHPPGAPAPSPVPLYLRQLSLLI